MHLSTVAGCPHYDMWKEIYKAVDRGQSYFLKAYTQIEKA